MKRMYENMHSTKKGGEGGKSREDREIPGRFIAIQSNSVFTLTKSQETQRVHLTWRSTLYPAPSVGGATANHSRIHFRTHSSEKFAVRGNQKPWASPGQPGNQTKLIVVYSCEGARYRAYFEPLQEDKSQSVNDDMGSANFKCPRFPCCTG